MTFTREELLLITAIALNPHLAWRHLAINCGMRITKAYEARRSLQASGIIGKGKVPCEDKNGRPAMRERWYVKVVMPFVDDVITWDRAGRSYPWPGPPPLRRPPTPQATQSRPPGKHRDPTERLLETILRNPHATWRTVRMLSGLEAKESLRAREDIETRAAVIVDVHTKTQRDGRSRQYRVLIPNENNSLVQELRKRYGLRRPVTLDQEILKARDLIRSTPARDGSPWRVEDIDTDPTLHAQTRVRRES